MHFLQELWMPILVSAVFVFVVSSILHMVIPIHKSDYKKLSNEDAVLEAMRANGVTPGEYMFPCAGSMKDMGTPEMIEKFNRGPVGNLTVIPNGTFNLGKSLTQWFLYSIVISVFAAYVTHAAVESGAPYLEVFRFAGTVAVMAYGLAYIPNSIWKGSSWVTTIKFMFDGVIYGLVTGGTFGWLWPGVTH